MSLLESSLLLILTLSFSLGIHQTAQALVAAQSEVSTLYKRTWIWRAK
jgi:hypothetical protein